MAIQPPISSARINQRGIFPPLLGNSIFVVINVTCFLEISDHFTDVDDCLGKANESSYISMSGKNKGVIKKICSRWLSLNFPSNYIFYFYQKCL